MGVAEVEPTRMSGIVADVGGTNARFAWIAAPGAHPQHIQVFTVEQFAGLEPAWHAYQAYLLAAGQNARVQNAVIAVASAVEGDFVRLTNGGWSFATKAVKQSLRLERLQVVNDFAALAAAIPAIQEADCLVVNRGEPRRGNRLVIGPGTGLGVAGLVPHEHMGWTIVTGEGGHATLAAMDEFEAAVLAVVQRQYSHVSGERLLSGIGLPTLCAAVAEVMGQGSSLLTTEQIVDTGTRRVDKVCERTMETFCAMLGSFAGSAALTLGARGGVYIAGGMVPRFVEFFHASQFMRRFIAKGRFSGYLQAIPVRIVTNTQLALEGCSQLMKEDAHWVL
jgi:glucokinase